MAPGGVGGSEARVVIPADEGDNSTNSPLI